MASGLWWTICLISASYMMVTCKVVMEITVLQYDNPLGTSYSQDNTHGTRKCCDTGGGSDCAGKSDTCDVYFSFCVGGTPMLMGPCNGTSIDMSQNVSTDVDYIGRGNNGGLTRVANLTWWKPNLASLLVDVLDIDEISTGAQQPSIVPDQIDTFNIPLPVMPAKDYWSAPAHVISLTNHASVDLQIRLWCQDGYYGDACQNNCPVDQDHECRGNVRIPTTQCTDPDALVLSFEGSIESRNIRTVIQQIPRFIADRMCPPATKFVNVTIDSVREDRTHRQMAVVFRTECDAVAISMLKLRQMIFSLENVNTRLGAPEDFLGIRVITPSINIVENQQSTKGSTLMMIRVLQYKGCAGCTLSLKAMNTTIWTWSSLTGQDERDCNGQLVDVQLDGPHTSSALSTTLIKLHSFPSYIRAFITEDGQPIADHVFPTEAIPTGRNFYDAMPYRFNVSNSNGTTLQVEVIAWCGNCYSGKYCTEPDQSTKCDPTVPHLEPECSDNSGCSNDAICSYNEVCSCKNNWLGRKCNTDVDECTSGICEHAQSCTNTPGDYTCTCNAGFTGANCNSDINECSSNPCDTKHFCLNTFGSYKCVCRDFQHNANCAKPNPCNMGPCFNKGTCVTVRDTFKCICMPGWTGPLCQADVNECQNVSACSYHGACVNTQGSYSCNCSGGWQGPACAHDVNDCSNKTNCSHHGTCSTSAIGEAVCDCLRGWQGEDCSVDVNECLNSPCRHNGTCDNFDGGYNCTCDLGWEDNNCTRDVDECRIPDICSNSGTCVNSEGSFHCACANGWTGNRCSNAKDYCADDPCGQYGTCSALTGGYNCVCMLGWKGPNCTEHVDVCTAISPCQHGGTCHPSNDSFSCTCPPAWTGSTCNKDVNECLLTPCANGAHCLNAPGGYRCTCTSGWTGNNCSTDVNECDQTDPCPSNTTCYNFPGGFNCTSHTNCSGVNCNNSFNDCVSSSLCQNGGTCLKVTSGYICSCADSWNGKHCEINIDACHNKSNPCQNGGTCISTNYTFKCACSPGWTGANCSVNINECVLFPGICDHGDCVDTQGSFKCICTQGFTGQNCTTDINECLQRQTCANNGTCVNLAGGYQCTCPHGWTGTKCSRDINECLATDVCHSNGMCINSGGSFTCVCNAGWTGSNCSSGVDECSTHPCKNGSTCVKTDGSFRCQCQKGLTGVRCESPLEGCPSVPCMNGGSCVNISGNTSCNCLPGFSGSHCESPLDECASAPCEHGGTCHSDAGNFTCVCPSGWSDSRCRSDVNECLDVRSCNLGSDCVNTPGSFICKTVATTSLSTGTSITTSVSGSSLSTSVSGYSLSTVISTSTISTTSSTTSMSTSAPTAHSTTGGTKVNVVDVFSLNFSSPVSVTSLPSVRAGIEKCLRFQQCKQSTAVLVHIVKNTSSAPNTVEFLAHCDGRLLSNSDISHALHDIPAAQLNQFFPSNLHVVTSSPQKQKTWLESHVTTVVCAVCGSVLLIVIIIGSVYGFRRSRRNKTMNNDIYMDSRIILDHEEKTGEPDTFAYQRKL